MSDDEQQQRTTGQFLGQLPCWHCGGHGECASLRCPCAGHARASFDLAGGSCSVCEGSGFVQLFSCEVSDPSCLRCAACVDRALLLGATAEFVAAWRDPLHPSLHAAARARLGIRPRPRRARKASRNVTPGLRHRILERDRFTCQHCGARAPHVRLEVDHIHPVSRGGTNEETNLQTLCATCNSGKSDRIVAAGPEVVCQ